jgi:hypothetical protein
MEPFRQVCKRGVKASTLLLKIAGISIEKGKQLAMREAKPLRGSSRKEKSFENVDMLIFNT